MEEIDSTANVKKRKKTVKDGIMGVATEYGDVAQMNEGGDKQKIEKKEKRGKAGGELVQNITSDGVEAGLASQHLDGHIVENRRRVILHLRRGRKRKETMERIQEWNCRNLWLKKWALRALKFKKTCSQRMMSMCSQSVHCFQIVRDFCSMRRLFILQVHG